MGYSIFGEEVLGEIRHKNRAVSSAVGSCLSSAGTCLPTYLPISIYTNARRNDIDLVSVEKRRFDNVVLKGLYVLSMVQYANWGRLISYRQSKCAEVFKFIVGIKKTDYTIYRLSAQV